MTQVSNQIFPWPVDLAGAAESVEYPVDTVSFGDGYAQRRPRGLAKPKRTWNVQKTCDPETAKAIEVFLDAHAGIRSFLWRPCQEDDYIKVIAAARDKQPVGKGYAIISLTLQETQ